MANLILPRKSSALVFTSCFKTLYNPPMKKTVISLLILFSAAFTALGQSVTLTPTTDKQLTLTAAGVAVPNITGQRSNGTSAAPTALPNGAWMMSIYGRGYNGSGYSTNASSVIAFGAAQDFTPTANGSNIQFLTAPLNTTSPLERMRIDHNGNVGIGVTDPQYRLDILHGGSTGVRVKSSASFSALDIDAFSGDASLRFAKNGLIQWNIRNNPGDNSLEIFELGGGGSRFWIQDATGNVGIGTNTFATGEKFAVSNGIRQFGIMPGYFGNVPDANWTTFNSLGLRMLGDLSVFGQITTNNGLAVDKFSKLGSDAPLIKVKKLTGTTGAAQGDIIPISHGLTSTKILSITVLVQFETNGQYVPHSYTNTNGYQFDFYSDATNIQVRNHPTNSGQILSKPIKVMITYEE